MTEQAHPGYPVIIPDYVIEQMRKWFKPEPADILNRKAQMWGGKSAIEYVADGDGTWSDVLEGYDHMFDVPL